MELAPVEALVLEVQMGKRAANGFKRESFVRMQTAVNLKNYRKLDVQQVKTKYHPVITWPTLCLAQLGTEIPIGHISRSSIALLNLSIIAVSDGMMSEVCPQQMLMYGTALGTIPKRRKPFKYLSELKVVLTGKSAAGANAAAPSALSSLWRIQKLKLCPMLMKG